MDNTAIETIQTTAVASVTNEIMRDLDVVMVPNTHKLASLKTYKPEPDRYRAQFKTDVLEDFIFYINNHETDSSKLFVEPRSPSAVAILDMGSPELPLWGEHKAVLKLNKTPEYAALIENNDQWLTQQTFIDFLQDWSGIITFSNPSSLENDVAHDISVATATGRFRKLNVNTTSNNAKNLNNYSASASAMEAIEIQAGDQTPPEMMWFTAKPYEGFTERRFRCETRASVKRDDVFLKYRIIALETYENDIAKELVETLSTNLEIVTYIGSIDYQS